MTKEIYVILNEGITHPHYDGDVYQLVVRSNKPLEWWEFELIDAMKKSPDIQWLGNGKFIIGGEERMTDWESWKKHEDWRERAIHRHQAEKEQIKLVPGEEGISLMKDENQIIVRDIFVGSIPNTWITKLQLGDGSPIVFVTTDNDIQFSFIPSLIVDEKR